MNARIKQSIASADKYLQDILKLHSFSSLSALFQHRHAEHLIAAGYGYENFHDYLAASKSGIELCAGYYIPDSEMIFSRLTSLGYTDAFAVECVRVFCRAVMNDGKSVRADFYDDVSGARVRVSNSDELANKSIFLQYLKLDVLREESFLWDFLKKQGIPIEADTEDHLSFSIDIAHDFPSRLHFLKTVDVPFGVRYDLEQGTEPLAVAFQQNPRIEFSGNLRMRPSGKRGWAYPTFRMQEKARVDHRTSDQIENGISVRQIPNVDEDEFEKGISAGRRNSKISAEESLDFCAGWIMTANSVNGKGHMSTGQVQKAFAGALTNARSLDGIAGIDAHELASRACRYLAANRSHYELENIIRKSAGKFESTQ